MNLEDQYDRIFRYLYFHLHDKHTAEDLTQETFLRFLKSRTYRQENRQLQYLYTIARNLCRQHYRDLTITYPLEEQEDIPASESLHYVNDVPLSVISGIYKISRFAAYRKRT